MKKCNPSENLARKLGQIITKKQNYVDDPTKLEQGTDDNYRQNDESLR